MKTIVLYTRVVASAKWAPPAESYKERTERFFTTYANNRPTQEHDLVICDCGGEGADVMLSEDPAVPYRKITYYGAGGDCGAYQFAANALDCDLLVCCNAGTYFWKDGWLYPLVSARREYGPGLYGVSASYERGPHLRTPCIAFDPAIVRDYPHAIVDREACNQFEAGGNSLTQWARDKKLPVFLMTWDEAIEVNRWRAPELQNIFRRGDQSNVMVWDRHTDIYESEISGNQAMLARYADGKH